MRVTILFFILLLALVVSGYVGAGYSASPVDWAPVERAMGTHGEVNPDGTIVFDLPRNLAVTLDGIRLSHGADLSHEVDFMEAGNKTLMVGELVLREDEVKEVTQKLLQAGIEETALHNHLLRESPHLMYLHMHAYGDPVQIAGTINNITSSLDGGIAPGADGGTLNWSVNTTLLDEVMGAKGKTGGGVYSYSVPRNDSIWMGNIELAPEMDISTGISFQPIGDGKAAIVGEFVLEADEVDPVVSSMTKNGIEVTALHSHMLKESPRLFYLHCWATGDAYDIGRGMHEALSYTNCIQK